MKRLSGISWFAMVVLLATPLGSLAQTGGTCTAQLGAFGLQRPSRVALPTKSAECVLLHIFIASVKKNVRLNTSRRSRESGNRGFSDVPRFPKLLSQE